MVEKTWDFWLGSATEIARLATLSERLLRFYFPPTPARVVDTLHSVSTPVWSTTPVPATELRDEIEARRKLVSIVEVRCYAAPRDFPINNLDNAKLTPVAPPPAPVSVAALKRWRRSLRWRERLTRLARLAGRRPKDPATPAHAPSVTNIETGVMMDPAQVRLMFRQSTTAVTLQVVARSPSTCLSLYSGLIDHVNAGARPHVWLAENAGLAGVCAGVAVSDVFLLSGAIGPAWTMLGQIVLGIVGFFVGSQLARWASPSLELVEAWERTRWQRVWTWAWQLVIVALSVAGIIVAVVLSEPSTPTH